MASALPAIRPRERSGDQTRRRLFETAIAEFRRVGVDRASIGRIAELAGVSRPAFYFHFPTKDHVLLELQWSFEEPIAARIAEAPTLDAALAALVEGLTDALERVGHPDVFAEMVRIHTRHAAGPELADQPHYMMRAVAARFVEAHAAGRLRAGLDAATAAHLFLTGVFGYLSVPAEPADARRDLRALVSLYFAEPRSRGARARKRS
jgi:TetR/AcrR family transcriptional repressor of uid operon